MEMNSANLEGYIVDVQFQINEESLIKSRTGEELSAKSILRLGRCCFRTGNSGVMAGLAESRFRGVLDTFVQKEGGLPLYDPLINATRVCLVYSLLGVFLEEQGS